MKKIVDLPDELCERLQEYSKHKRETETIAIWSAIDSFLRKAGYFPKRYKIGDKGFLDAIGQDDLYKEFVSTVNNPRS